MRIMAFAKRSQDSRRSEKTSFPQNRLEFSSFVHAPQWRMNLEKMLFSSFIYEISKQRDDGVTENHKFTEQ